MKRSFAIILTAFILVAFAYLVAAISTKEATEVGVAILMGIISVFIVDKLGIKHED